MQFSYASVLALVSAVAANEWTFSCGSSCDNLTTIVSGSDYVGTTCTDFGPYEYCSLTSDVSWYKVLLFQLDNCL
ncbi:hypothetical protein BX600DRAFT_462871, partial [Xylariales sp. PMI_506]